MAGFDAGNVVEPLIYDFSALAEPPHLIKKLADVKGTIREPMPLQVQEYVNASRAQMVRLRRETGVVDEEDADAVLSALEKMDPARTMAEAKHSADILSALCSGHPTAAQLVLLPHRVMHAFGEWLAKEVLDPEAVTGAGRLRLTSLPSSSAG
jgi:hypothetical protein